MKRSRLSCNGKSDLRKLRLKHGSDPDSKFNNKQLAMGIKIEMEHTNLPDLAKQVAKAHLAEFPKYYTYLDSMEGLMKKV